jgi:DNA-directed RNA polymerase subunit RPC12/RpoP
MKCNDCGEEILQTNPTKCPYCGSRNLVADSTITSKEKKMTKEYTLEQIEKLVKSGRFEEAARLYEKLEMYEKAGECRRMEKTHYVVNTNLNIGKIGTISLECPHCGASHPINSKASEIVCEYCKKTYVVPKKVLDLL